MHTKTVTELSDGLSSGEFSSVELVEHFQRRIALSGDPLNAFISVSGDAAITAARAADARRKAGNAGPLTGLPLAYKDIFCTTEAPTTCGSKMLDGFQAPYDATVVERLNSAGTVSLGKTNMDEFAMGSSNENSFFGPVGNPWDPKRVPGGSSGGSACAVAAGLTPVALGTDTGGSIRQPAAFCGLTGIKPTYGRVSRFGMVAFASSLDQAGVLAHSAEDAALILQEIAGFDPRDSTSADAPVPDYRATLADSMAGLKIGVPDQFFDEGLDAAVGARVQEGLSEMQRLGATLVPLALPSLRHAVPAYYIVAPAEASSNLSRFDGVRFGHRCDNPADLTDLYKRSRGEGFGDEVKRRILTGTYVLSAGYFDAYYLKAQRMRQRIANDFSQAFDKVDVIMGPTTPTPAFPIGEKSGDPVTMYLNDIYTVAVNLAGLPALSVPCGYVDKLPVGLQMIGRHFAEPQLLSAAHAYQQVTGWHRDASPALEAQS